MMVNHFYKIKSKRTFQECSFFIYNAKKDLILLKKVTKTGVE